MSDHTNSITLPCLYCGAPRELPADGHEARGEFNVYCPDRECEDNHAMFDCFGLGPEPYARTGVPMEHAATCALTVAGHPTPRGVVCSCHLRRS